MSKRTNHKKQKIIRNTRSRIRNGAENQVAESSYIKKVRKGRTGVR